MNKAALNTQASYERTLSASLDDGEELLLSLVEGSLPAGL